MVRVVFEENEADWGWFGGWMEVMIRLGSREDVLDGESSLLACLELHRRHRRAASRSARALALNHSLARAVTS